MGKLFFKPVRSQLEYSQALSIIVKSFSTVAPEFNITRENCPANPAFMNIEKLNSLKTNKTELYILYSESVPAGFVAIEESSSNSCLFYIEKLSVLPRFRHKKLGEKLMEFAEDQIRRRGGKEISLGVIYENIRLRNWYKTMGYLDNGTKVFPHLPFTVGFMCKALR